MHRPIEKHEGRRDDCPRCVPALARQYQADFVKAWRAEHAGDVWGDEWRCPLCNVVAQFGPGSGVYPVLDNQIERHQDNHGPDWLAYAALGAPADSQGG